MTYPYSHAASIAEYRIRNDIRDKIAAANILPADLNNMVADYATISPIAERLASFHFSSCTHISDHVSILLYAINGCNNIRGSCVYCSNDQPHIDVWLGVGLSHRTIGVEKMCGKFQIQVDEILLYLTEGLPIICTESMSRTIMRGMSWLDGDQINADHHLREELHISESHALVQITEIFTKFRDYIIW